MFSSRVRRAAAALASALLLSACSLGSGDRATSGQASDPSDSLAVLLPGEGEFGGDWAPLRPYEPYELAQAPDGAGCPHRTLVSGASQLEQADVLVVVFATDRCPGPWGFGPHELASGVSDEQFEAALLEVAEFYRRRLSYEDEILVGAIRVEVKESGQPGVSAFDVAATLDLYDEAAGLAAQVPFQAVLLARSSGDRSLALSLESYGDIIPEGEVFRLSRWLSGRL